MSHAIPRAGPWLIKVTRMNEPPPIERWSDFPGKVADSVGVAPGHRYRFPELCRLAEKQICFPPGSATQSTILRGHGQRRVLRNAWMLIRSEGFSTVEDFDPEQYDSFRLYSTIVDCKDTPKLAVRLRFPRSAVQ